MLLTRLYIAILLFILFLSPAGFAENKSTDDVVSKPNAAESGSWTFSGMVTNESGDRYGYFFQIQRQDNDFQVKTALVDGQSNQLLFFYEEKESIANPDVLNWHVGHSFMRYNPINDSWIFGVKMGNAQRFNFKVDMLKQTDDDKETIALRPGLQLQALQTSRVNGHIQIASDAKEQFVTAKNAWFGKLWLNEKQKSAHDISTTFCRLSNDNGFYSANLKEADATGAAVAGWRDSAGNKVKMSQFISIKSLADNQCLLNVGLPKLHLKLNNTLKHAEKKQPLYIAGFSKNDPKSFCIVTEQSFKKA